MDKMQQFASVVELVPEKEQEYRKLHANVWPEVQAAIKRANIHNYSIHVGTIEGKRYLFSYFEYSGNDFEGDMASIAEDPTTRDRWWPLTDACQKRIEGTPEGQQWLPLEMAMHLA